MEKKKKERVGIDPLEASLIKDTRKKKTRTEDEDQEAKWKEVLSQVIEDKEEQVRRMLEERISVPNCYINKKGEVIQRILIHVPWIMAERLREEAFNSLPRKSLSHVIREKLK